MYCIKCGARLSEGQTMCPLCHTRVYHPELLPKDSPTYPREEFESEAFNPKGILFVLTVFFSLAALLPMLSEMVFFHMVTWSGYLLGGVILGYLLFLLPIWFKNPNPVVFIPCDFGAALLFLLYIDLVNHGGWFLSFAFPVGGALALIVTAAAALWRYVRKGYLYILGGTLIALGIWTALIEFFLWLTFHVGKVLSWSLCSLVSLFALGMALIVIAMVKPLRDSLRKKFFL